MTARSTSQGLAGDLAGAMLPAATAPAAEPMLVRPEAPGVSWHGSL